jgi:uncharacterized protein
MTASHERLRTFIADLGPMIVAFSGGVDSTLLLRVAHDVLGDSVLAVTAVSASLARSEREQAAQLSRRIGAPHQFVETRELEDPDYARNDGRRCYHCKKELFRALRDIAPLARGRALTYGAILDDLQEERPGMEAAAAAGARAPLLEVGFTKEMVRDLSRQLGLPTWDKPAMACLSSRIPRHMPVTEAALRQVDVAEEAVRALGFRQVRVRHQGAGARVEIDPRELRRATEPGMAARIAAAVGAAGFAPVIIDPLGYHPGGATPLVGPPVPREP